MLPKFLRNRLGASHLKISPPKPRRDRFGLAIVAIVKNEANYAGEWARFHLLAGVRFFIIYDDGSTDQTVEVLREAIPDDMLYVIPWSQRLIESRLGLQIHNQVLAYAHAISNFGQNFRWMAFIDIDEYLVPVESATLTDALSGLGVAENVSLPWHMFGFNGHETAPEGGIVSNYVNRAVVNLEGDRRAIGFKMIADPCKTIEVSVHSMRTLSNGVTWNDAGFKARFEERSRNAFYSAERIQLNHYYTRSRSELMQKIARGHNLPSKSLAYKRKVKLTAEAIEKTTKIDRKAIEWRDEYSKSL